MTLIDSKAFFVAPATSVAPVSPPIEVLGASEIRRAIRSRSKVWLTYSDSNGHDTERLIWPILVDYRDVGRILAAWCKLRSDFRYFRTERITGAEVRTEKIPRRMAILRQEWRDAMDTERRRFQGGVDS